MSNFPIYHGITLAENAYIENLNVEVLAADPVPVGPGRVWFNGTDRVFKFSGLNASGAVIIRTFATAEELAAQLASLTSDYQAADAAEASAREAGDVQTLSDAKSYSDTKHAEALAYADAVKASLLGGIPPETLDTLTELAAALKNNPDIVDVLQNQIIDGIAAAKAELKGTVTEAMDTLGEIETALNSEIADRTAAVNAEQQAREAGDAALDSRLTTVEGQVNGKIGNLSSLHTDEKGSLVGAINEVQDEVEAEAARASAAETTITNRVAAEETRAAAAESALQNAVDAEIAARQQAVADEAAARAAAVAAEENARIAAVAAVRSDYNAKRVTFQSGAAATTHIIQHNMNADFVNFTVLVQRPDGKYRNDVVSVEEVDNNTLKVYLSAAAHIKAAVESMASL